jgi:hypothetical protein
VIGLALCLAVEEDSEDQGLGEEVLADLNIEGAQLPHILRRLLLPDLEHLVPLDVVLGRLHINSVAHLHEFDDLWDQVMRDASLDGYVSSMQVHVTTLDTLHA